jgi:hypothetical protein
MSPYSQVLIPPVVTTPTPIFANAYIDTMHMPPSGAYKYIVQARCSLSYYPKFHMLRAETGSMKISYVSGDLSKRLLLTMVQLSSK